MLLVEGQEQSRDDFSWSSWFYQTLTSGKSEMSRTKQARVAAGSRTPDTPSILENAFQGFSFFPLFPETLPVCACVWGLGLCAAFGMDFLNFHVFSH